MAIELLSRDGEVKSRPNYRPERRTLPIMAHLSFAEKQRLIESDPDYGVIVCRCEQISLGEIKAQMKAPVPALTLDAVKRRVRAGMGRCQGGFCSPGVMKIISQSTGRPLTSVTKSGPGSEIAVGTTQKGVTE